MSMVVVSGLGQAETRATLQKNTGKRHVFALKNSRLGDIPNSSASALVMNPYVEGMADMYRRTVINYQSHDLDALKRARQYFADRQHWYDQARRFNNWKFLQGFVSKTVIEGGEHDAQKITSYIKALQNATDLLIAQREAGITPRYIFKVSVAPLGSYVEIDGERLTDPYVIEKYDIYTMLIGIGPGMIAPGRHILIAGDPSAGGVRKSITVSATENTILQPMYAGAKPKRVRFYVYTGVTGLKVYVDNRYSGRKTPATFQVVSAPSQVGEISPGLHNIKIIGEGFDTQEMTVNVSPDSDSRWQPTISPTKRFLKIRSEPAGWQIFIDGQDTGLQTPADLEVPSEISTGNHTVTLKYAGFYDRIKGTFVASANDTILSFTETPRKVVVAEPVVLPTTPADSQQEDFTALQEARRKLPSDPRYYQVLIESIDYWLKAQNYFVRPEDVWYVPKNIYDRFLLEIKKRADADGSKYGYVYDPIIVRDAFEQRGYKEYIVGKAPDRQVVPSIYDQYAKGTAVPEPKPIVTDPLYEREEKPTVPLPEIPAVPIPAPEKTRDPVYPAIKQPEVVLMPDDPKFYEILNESMDYWLGVQRYQLRPEYVWYVPKNIYDRFLLEIKKRADANGTKYGFSFDADIVKDAFERRGYMEYIQGKTPDRKVASSPYDKDTTQTAIISPVVTPLPVVPAQPATQTRPSQIMPPLPTVPDILPATPSVPPQVIQPPAFPSLPAGSGTPPLPPLPAQGEGLPVGPSLPPLPTF